MVAFVESGTTMAFFFGSRQHLLFLRGSILVCNTKFSYNTENTVIERKYLTGFQVFRS